MGENTVAGDSARLRAGYLSLGIGILVFGGKLAAWGLTGSAAVFSDAMESTVNVVAACVLVLSLVVASWPADRSHPYGHGNVEFLSAGFEGAMIVVAAVLILIESVPELWRGSHLQQLDLGMLLLLGMSLLNLALGGFLVRQGRTYASAALEADGRHILTDVWTSAGVIVGLLAVRVTGLTWLDPVIAILVALNILREGVRIARSAIAGLMNEADDELLAVISDGLEQNRDPWWIDVHGLRAWRSGASVHVDLHLTIPRYFDAERLHEVHDKVEATVAAACSGLPGDVIVHFDPCRPVECAGCAMPDCAVRSSAFEARKRFEPGTATRPDFPLPSDRPRPTDRQDEASTP